MPDHHLSFESRNPGSDKELLFRQLRDFAESCHWLHSIANEVELILEEWWTNLLHYALTETAHPHVVVRIAANRDLARIEVRDNGVPFDPTAQPDPDLTLPLEERPIGGLGIYMMKKLSSHLSSERLGDQNILRIDKDLQRPALGRSE